MNTMPVISGKVRPLLVGTLVMSAVAMVISAYLIYLHYEPSAANFCNVSVEFNCDIVNKSQWSYLEVGSVEVPVAVLGFVYYLAMVIGLWGLIRGWKFDWLIKFLKPRFCLGLMMFFTLLGLGFTVYLTAIETFVLKTYCLFCVAQQILILLMTPLLALALFDSGWKSKE